MIVELTLFIAVISSLERTSGLASPQFQYTYGVPTFAAAPAPFPAPFPTLFSANFPALFSEVTPAALSPVAPPAALSPAAPPAAPPAVSFPAAPPEASFPAAPPAISGPSVQEDAGALELLPPLQHVVGTRYPAVSAGKGYRFPISQLLNPTPPPNLKH